MVRDKTFRRNFKCWIVNQIESFVNAKPSFSIQLFVDKWNVIVGAAWKYHAHKCLCHALKGVVLTVIGQFKVPSLVIKGGVFCNSIYKLTQSITENLFGAFFHCWFYSQGGSNEKKNCQIRTISNCLAL